MQNLDEAHSTKASESSSASPRTVRKDTLSLVGRM
jgi:hypothetical protein